MIYVVLIVHCAHAHYFSSEGRRRAVASRPLLVNLYQLPFQDVTRW
jgi:hypothetical protein